MSKIFSVHVPFIPPFDKETETPKWFEERVKEFSGLDLKYKDYELTEIVGSRVVKCFYDDCPCKGKDFIETGYHALYTLKAKK